MTIKFKTNIDHYKKNCFPENLTQVPRKGDMVMVNQVLGEYFSKKGLPLALEVVQVNWCELGVIVELHYSEHHIKMAQISGVNLF